MGVTDALNKIKMAHLNTWYTPWKISENFGEDAAIGMPPIPREGGREGMRGVTVLHHRLLCNKTWRKRTPRSFCRVQRKPQNLHPFDMVNVTKNAYLCRRKTTETAVREQNPSNYHGISHLTCCPPVRLQNSKQPRNSSPMRQDKKITSDISSNSRFKHSIEWE